MKRGIPFGRWGGVPVLVGPSWLVVVPLVGIALFAGIEPRLGSTWERALVASAGTVLMFGSVLVHELGHVVAARRRGITVQRLVVFLFGGYSEMDLESADPGDDVAVSLAGPIASGMLALAMVVAALGAPEWAGARRTLALLGLVNVGVALFNMLPGFPLDGGRVVRAALIAAGVDRRRSETITSRLGIAMGLVAIAVGLWLSVRGEPASIVAVPVGMLVLVIAAAAHPRRRPRVSDVMLPAPSPVGEADAMAALADRLDDPVIPVVTSGRVVGFVDPSARGTLVAEAMVETVPGDVVATGDVAAHALDRVARTGRPVAVVHRGRLVGVVAPGGRLHPPPQAPAEKI